MKKLICAVLSAAILLSALPAFAAYSDVPTSSDYYASSVRLRDLKIVSGYEDGTFRPDNKITRAEFIKIVVCMMDKENEAVASQASSGFFDVPAGSWFSPYINFAVAKDILSGYSDGSFAPYNTIRYDEAITILMRTLGYTETDVGYFWPDNYMSAASSLGLTRDLGYDPAAQLTRATAAILVDRALFTKPAASKNADTYLETVGCKVLKDALILDYDTTSNNVSVLSGNLKLNSASTYISTTALKISEGDTFEFAVVDKNGYLAAVREYSALSEIASETAIVNRLTGNTIEYTTIDGRKGTYKADDSFVTYYDNNKMSFSSAKAHITNGADVTFYGTAKGLWNIAVIGNSNDVEPVLASHDYSPSDTHLEGTSINKTNLVIYRNGEAAALDDIKASDVVYYNIKTNTMDVYSKKITGIYYSASPSKAYVESVSVGGKSYEIGHSSATSKLDASYGAFEIGDKVTLLLGKNDKIAFCTDNSSSFDYYEYGVLISNSTRTSTEGKNEGMTENVAQLFMADGEIHEIVTDKQYKENIGELMKLTYKNGIASLARHTTNNADNFAGKIDKNERTIGSKYLLQDAAIIQLNSDYGASLAECELLDFEHLTADEINSSEIINVITANKFGDIAIMFVKNFESSYEYGVISGFTKSGTSTTGYNIFSNSSLNTYTLSDVLHINTSAGSGVGYKVSGGRLTKLVPLSRVTTSGSLSAVEGSRIMVGSTIYKMAADVQLVDISNMYNMRTITIDELDSMSSASVTLYSDKALSSGGMVRVVTVKK